MRGTKYVATFGDLTARERQVANLVAEGLSNKGIGQRLKVTEGTVKLHVHSIYRKLELSGRAALVALVIKKAMN
ncbi:LuxR C-terminal-related transcriptional regulator [Bradyrhizobium sp. Tv2a-2]|uniref:response regulator transcription factor n=1 Tax=Bradyrhizobium sp. Tv2a-2 TaxID=113395 RepID=UPI000466BC49|nr:LuxR C-terminal-related transcriptional regulator [Bradyrhizobium sp. Tv2a-2]